MYIFYQKKKNQRIEYNFTILPHFRNSIDVNKSTLEKKKGKKG